MNLLMTISLFCGTVFLNPDLREAVPLKISGSVNTIVFSPDGTKLLVSLDDNTARILDAVSGNVLLTLKGHNNKVNTANYSPDGSLIVTSSDDKTAKIWNALTGEFMYDLREKDYEISSAQFSPDGKKILTVCPTAVKIWKAKNAKYENQVINVPGVIFTTACFSADGRFVFTGSSDKSVKRWEIGHDKPLATMIKHNSMIKMVYASPDGKFLISSGIGFDLLSGLVDTLAFVWDAKEGYEVCSIPEQSDCRNLQSSPDGKNFLACNGLSVSVIRFSDCKLLAEPIFDLKEFTMNTAIFSPDGSKILTVSGSGTLKYWDVQTGKYLSMLN